MTKRHDNENDVPSHDPADPVIPDGFTPDVEGAMRIPAPRPFTAEELAAHATMMAIRWPALAVVSGLELLQVCRACGRFTYHWRRDRSEMWQCGKCGELISR